MIALVCGHRGVIGDKIHSLLTQHDASPINSTSISGQYPLVIENHHFLWKTPLFLWPFSIAMWLFTRRQHFLSMNMLHVWDQMIGCPSNSPHFLAAIQISFITPGILFRGALIGTGWQAVKHSSIKHSSKLGKITKISKTFDKIGKHYIENIFMMLIVVYMFKYVFIFLKDFF